MSDSQWHTSADYMKVIHVSTIYSNALLMKLDVITHYYKKNKCNFQIYLIMLLSGTLTLKFVGFSVYVDLSLSNMS